MLNGVGWNKRESNSKLLRENMMRRWETGSNYWTNTSKIVKPSSTLDWKITLALEQGSPPEQQGSINLSLEEKLWVSSLTHQSTRPYLLRKRLGLEEAAQRSEATSSWVAAWVRKAWTSDQQGALKGEQASMMALQDQWRLCRGVQWWELRMTWLTWEILGRAFSTNSRCLLHIRLPSE